jgi:hypothetical protein
LLGTCQAQTTCGVGTKGREVAPPENGQQIVPSTAPWGSLLHDLGLPVHCKAVSLLIPDAEALWALEPRWAHPMSVSTVAVLDSMTS